MTGYVDALQPFSCGLFRVNSFGLWTFALQDTYTRITSLRHVGLVLGRGFSGLPRRWQLLNLI